VRDEKEKSQGSVRCAAPCPYFFSTKEAGLSLSLPAGLWGTWKLGVSWGLSGLQTSHWLFCQRRKQGRPGVIERATGGRWRVCAIGKQLLESGCRVCSHRRSAGLVFPAYEGEVVSFLGCGGHYGGFTASRLALPPNEAATQARQPSIHRAHRDAPAMCVVCDVRGVRCAMPPHHTRRI